MRTWLTQEELEELVRVIGRNVTLPKRLYKRGSKGVSTISTFIRPRRAVNAAVFALCHKIRLVRNELGYRYRMIKGKNHNTIPYPGYKNTFKRKRLVGLWWLGRQSHRRFSAQVESYLTPCRAVPERPILFNFVINRHALALTHAAFDANFPARPINVIAAPFEDELNAAMDFVLKYSMEKDLELRFIPREAERPREWSDDGAPALTTFLPQAERVYYLWTRFVRGLSREEISAMFKQGFNVRGEKRGES